MEAQGRAATLHATTKPERRTLAARIASVRSVEDAVGQNFGRGSEELLRDLVAFAVGVVRQAGEALFDAEAGRRAEVIDQLEQGVVFFAGSGGGKGMSTCAGRANGE